MEVQVKKRIGWIDIAKGIAIICTIVGHSIGKARVVSLIFSFHMPLFFMLSGYTLKKIPLSELKLATVKDFKRLIIPVLIVFAVDFLLQLFLFGASVPVLLKTDIKKILWGTLNKGGGVLWFLIALFYSKFFFRIVLNKIPKYREMFLLVGTYIFSVPKLKIELPQNFDLIFVGMLFMDAGYILRNSVDEDSPKLEKLGVIAFFIWIYLVRNKKIYVDLAQRIYPVLAIIAAICGALCVIQLCKLFECSKLLTKVTGFFGKRSLDLLCIHQLDGLTGNCVLKYLEPEKLNPYVHCFVRILFYTVVLLCLVGARILFRKAVAAFRK